MHPKGSIAAQNTEQREKPDAAMLYLNCFEGTLFSISFLRAFSVSFSTKMSSLATNPN